MSIFGLGRTEIPSLLYYSTVKSSNSWIRLVISSSRHLYARTLKTDRKPVSLVGVVVVVKSKVNKLNNWAAAQIWHDIQTNVFSFAIQDMTSLATSNLLKSK